MPKPSKPTKQQRELRVLLLCEQLLKDVLTFSRPTQSYDFVREPLARIIAEREVLELAQLGDPAALRLRRARRGA